MPKVGGLRLERLPLGSCVLSVCLLGGINSGFDECSGPKPTGWMKAESLPSSHLRRAMRP